MCSLVSALTNQRSVLSHVTSIWPIRGLGWGCRNRRILNCEPIVLSSTPKLIISLVATHIPPVSPIYQCQCMPEIYETHHCTLKLDADKARIRSYIDKPWIESVKIWSLLWNVEMFQKHFGNVKNQHTGSVKITWTQLSAFSWQNFINMESFENLFVSSFQNSPCL